MSEQEKIWILIDYIINTIHSCHLMMNLALTLKKSVSVLEKLGAVSVFLGIWISWIAKWFGGEWEKINECH